MSYFDTLNAPVIHHFFQIIVFKKRCEVTIWIGLDVAIDVVNWRGMVGLCVNGDSSVLF